MNKSLLIPYIPELDTLSLENTSTFLEEKGARISIDSLLNAGEYPYHPLTVVNIAHTDKALFIDFFVRSNYLRAVNSANNTPVWEDSSISFLIQPNDSETYHQFHFNCIGTINASTVTSEATTEQLSDEDITKIEVLCSCGNKPFRELEGLFTWNVLVKLPLNMLGIDYKGTPVLAKGNFCKSASATSQPHFLTWNRASHSEPIFYKPSSFGDIIFG